MYAPAQKRCDSAKPEESRQCGDPGAGAVAAQRHDNSSWIRRHRRHL